MRMGCGSLLTYPVSMRRVVLDSDGVDPIADIPGAYEAVRSAVESGQLELLYPHITQDQVADTPNEEKRARLLRVLDLGQLVPSGGFAFGVSKFDQARFGPGQEELDEVTPGTDVRGVKDALIAVTAEYEQCALVTYDTRLTSRARRRGIEVLEPRKLLAELGLVVPNSS